MKVLFLPEVRQYLDEVSHILYQKDYFGYEYMAERYVEELLQEIKTTLPVRLKKPAPPHFERYGKKMYYAAFRKNKTTQWYVFFSIYEENHELVYLIRYITNNHIAAKFL